MPNEIHDLRRTKHFIVDHLIVDEYLPAIGAKAFQLYAIYCRIASTHNRVFPSFRAIRKNTGLGFNSIQKFNQVLEEVGLLKIIREKSKSGDNDNNKYILLDPKHLTPDLKKKFYPPDWEPILKMSQGAITAIAPQNQDLSGGATATVAPVLSPREHRATPAIAQVLSPGEHINNKDVVVNLNKTTTDRYILELQTAFQQAVGKPVVVESGLISIFKTAQAKCETAEEAYQLILDKITTIKLSKAEDPLKLLHKAVKENWTDYSSSKRQEAKIKQQQRDEEKLIQSRAAEEFKEYWETLSTQEKAERCLEAATGFFTAKHRRRPTADEKQKILDDLITKGTFGPISISTPIFKEGDSWQA
jgi:hypothetical protein